MDTNLEDTRKQQFHYEYAGKINVEKNEAGLNLYKHQQEAIQKLNKKIINAKQSLFSGLLVLPTGGGKTLIAAYWLLKNYIDKSKKVIWIAHRHELLEQAKETFQNIAYSDILENKISFNYRVISGIHDKPINIKSTDDLIIASKDSLNSGFEHLYNNWIKNNNEEIFLIIDEAHHATAKTYRKIIDNLREKVKNLKILGLTATPTRTAENEKGLLKKVFPDDIVYKTDLRTLINRGILSEPVFEEIKTEIDMTEILNEREIDNLKYFDIDSLRTSTAKTIAENASRNNRIVEHYVRNKSKYKQTIVFSLNVDNAIALKTIFTKKGIKSDYVVSTLKDTSVDTGVSPKENKARIKSFRRGDLDVLINVNILTEGIDLPAVQTVFLTRPTISPILMTQMIGRGLRGEKAGGTKEAYIVSFIDDWKDKISWINPEKLLIQENINFTDKTKDRDKKVLRLVSIEKIEEFAKIMDRTIDTKDLEDLEFIKRIPVGIYSFSILKPCSNEDIEKNCEILVYDNIKEAYEDFIISMSYFFTENNLLEKDSFTEKELETLCNKVDEEFFHGCEKLPGYLREDIKDLIIYYAQKQEIPQLIELKDREKYDITKIANEIYEKDFGEKRKKEYLSKIWNDKKIAWKAFFGFDERYFRNEIDIAIRKISRPDLFKTSHKKPVEKKELEEIEYFSMSKLYEKYPEYWRKLRDSVYEKYKDKDGNYTCAVSGFKSKNKRHFYINHITPISEGGLTFIDNLQILSTKGNLLEEEKVADNAIEWNNKAVTLYEQGRYEEAIEYYDKALKLSPEDIDIWSNKGNTLYEQGRYEEAIKCYDKALKFSPENVDIWNDKGNTLYEQGRYEEAIKCYDKALKFSPENVDIWNNKGNTLYKQGKYLEAIECYNKSLKLSPENVDIWNDKGEAYLALKKYKIAIECYNKALTISPQNICSLKHKKLCLDKLKDYKENNVTNQEKLDSLYFLRNKLIEIKENNVSNQEKPVSVMQNLIVKHNEEKLPQNIKIFCKTCGEENVATIRFCKECGSALDKSVLEIEALSTTLYAKDSTNMSSNIEKNQIITPDNWNKKGLELYNQHRYEEAIRCYNKALEIAPEHKESLHNKKYVESFIGLEETFIRPESYQSPVLKKNKDIIEDKQEIKSYDIFTPITVKTYIETFTDTEFIYIKGGTFRIKQNKNIFYILPNYDLTNTNTSSFIIVGNFYISKYPITNKEYCLYKPSHNNPGDNLPVVNVSWYDAVNYCNWLSKKTGNNYRLPTEAEWEYACRAGSNTEYYWGDNMDDSFCWYRGNSGGKIQLVGQKKPNSWGLYDMSGNVWEWCSDTDKYSSLLNYIERGGSWYDFPNACRSSSSSMGTPDLYTNYLGFRILKVAT